MNKVQSFNRSFSDLPCEILGQILGRLSIKSCLTCKLVCKDWYHMIISPRFTDLRSRRVTFVLRRYLSDGRRINFMLLEIDKGSDYVVKRTSVTSGGSYEHPTTKYEIEREHVLTDDEMLTFKSKLGVPHCKLDIINVCNGLVFLKSKSGCYYICKLLTSQCVMVNQPRDRSTKVCGGGLGFCAATQQYKILWFFKSPKVKEYVAEVATLGSDTSRSVDGTLKSFFSGGPLLNDSLHWYCFVSKCLYAFHFGTEQFLNFPAPDEVKPKTFDPQVTIFDSCLTFCCNSRPMHRWQTAVWVMKEYGVNDSWVLQYILWDEWDFNLEFNFRLPLLQMDNGKLLVIRDNSDECSFAFYDPSTEEYKDLNIYGVACRLWEIHAYDTSFSLMPGVGPGTS